MKFHHYMTDLYTTDCQPTSLCAVNTMTNNSGMKRLNTAWRRRVFIEILQYEVPQGPIPGSLQYWKSAPVRRPPLSPAQRAWSEQIKSELSCRYPRTDKRPLRHQLSKQNIPATRPSLIGALNPLWCHKRARRGDSFVSTYARRMVIFSIEGRCHVVTSKSGCYPSIVGALLP